MEQGNEDGKKQLTQDDFRKLLSTPRRTDDEQSVNMGRYRKRGGTIGGDLTEMKKKIWIGTDNREEDQGFVKPTRTKRLKVGKKETQREEWQEKYRDRAKERREGKIPAGLYEGSNLYGNEISKSGIISGGIHLNTITATEDRKSEGNVMMEESTRTYKSTETQNEKIGDLSKDQEKGAVSELGKRVLAALERSRRKKQGVKIGGEVSVNELFLPYRMYYKIEKNEIKMIIRSKIEQREKQIQEEQEMGYTGEGEGEKELEKEMFNKIKKSFKEARRKNRWKRNQEDQIEEEKVEKNGEMSVEIQEKKQNSRQENTRKSTEKEVVAFNEEEDDIFGEAGREYNLE